MGNFLLAGRKKTLLYLSAVSHNCHDQFCQKIFVRDFSVKNFFVTNFIVRAKTVTGNTVRAKTVKKFLSDISLSEPKEKHFPDVTTFFRYPKIQFLAHLKSNILPTHSVSDWI